jgi:hypothetical protein
MEWGAAVAAIFGVIAVLLKAYISRQPERERDDHEKEIQTGRQDIVAGDVGAVESRIDGLLADQAGPGDSATGEPSAEDVEGRIGRL